MSQFNFVNLVAADIAVGKVVKSKFATAGPYHEAVEGDSFAVFDDLNGDRIKVETPTGAAFLWHKINLEGLRKERLTNA